MSERRCEGCGQPIEGGRAHRRFHDDACRKRASRGGAQASPDLPSTAEPNPDTDSPLVRVSPARPREPGQNPDTDSPLVRVSSPEHEPNPDSLREAVRVSPARPQEPGRNPDTDTPPVRVSSPEHEPNPDIDSPLVRVSTQDRRPNPDVAQDAVRVSRTEPPDPEPSPEVIRATWRWLGHGPHGVSEVRVIRPSGGIVGIGFFDDEDAFVRECVRTNAAGNVYVGIQPRPRRLLDLATNAIRPLRTGAGRKDIEVLTATVIDLDPVRPKDTASTDAELELALDAARAAADWCEAEGLVRPRLMMSGNGAQLWFALPPTPLEGAARERLQAGLKAFEAAVRERSQTDAVHVDSIHDVARIIKVIGTVSHKGDGQGDRPHRLSAVLTGFERVEDPALLARLDVEPAPELPLRPAPRPSPPGAAPAPPPAASAAARTPEGDYDWERPVEMCGPVQRLWEQGAEDRSLAIFNMVRFFAHKGLPLDQITDLVVEYDRRGLGKLKGRDGPAYVRKAYEKILATARDDGTIAPPCHALQKLGYCRANREPGARCELYDVVFDVEKAIEAVPTDVPARELEYRLKPILDAIAHRDPSMHGRYLALVEKRFGLKAKDLRKAVARAASAPGRDDDAQSDAETTDSAIEGEIYEDASCYYCVTARGESKILSSFTIEPTMRVETEDGELILGVARTDKGTVVAPLRLPLGAFHSKRDLIRQLPSADLQWTGSDNNVQGLLRVLARRPVPCRPGSNMLGEYRKGEHHVWLGPDCAIGKGGFLEPSPVIYVPSGASLDKRVKYAPADDDSFLLVATTVFEHLPRANKPEVMLPILGWFFATPMKPQLMKAVGSFPVLFVWGTQGSGKSSICTEVMWPLFGVRDAEPYSSTETEFALLKLLTSTRSIPVFIDEYKPYDMQRQRVNTLHRYLRRLYRGETEERGRPDLKVNTYHLQAPVCIAGETRPTEAALLERIVTANPAKTTLDELPSYKHSFRELRSVDLPLIAPRYIQFCLGRDFAVDLEVARQVTRAMIGERKVPVRIVDNVTAVLLGVHLFEEFAHDCSCELADDLGVQAAVDAMLADVLETDHGVKNALDHFLEMLGVMAVQGELKHRVHYAFEDSYLALHLESAYDAFRAHCRRIDYEGELVDLKALRRLVLENHKQGGFVVTDSKRVYFDGRTDRRRAVVIDLTKTGVVTEDDFPRRDSDDEGSSRGFKGRYGWSDAS